MHCLLSGAQNNVYKCLLGQEDTGEERGDETVAKKPFDSKPVRKFLADPGDHDFGERLAVPIRPPEMLLRFHLIDNDLQTARNDN